MTEMYYTAIPALEDDTEHTCGHKHGSMESAWACSVTQMHQSVSKPDCDGYAHWKPVHVIGGRVHEKYYLNEYLTSRECGGPEEGGWWYDTGRLVGEHGRFDTKSLAELARDVLSGYLKREREGQHEPSSVLCSGYTELYIEPHPGMSYPWATPQYC